MANQLTKGQNGPLNSSEVVIAVAVGAPADLSALLVTDGGTVRNDADFIFFNQPTGPGVRLHPAAPGQPANLMVHLPSVPADIAKVRAVITLEDAASRFGVLTAPVAHISDAAGTTLYEYRIEGLSSESIVIAIELYRRNGTWKVRAVGQGYSGGFAALVTDHGVSVDDAPAPAVTPPPAHPQSVSAPTLSPTHTPPPPTASSAVREPVEVSLIKGRPVNLSKGQRISLRKDDGVALSRVRMGLGWDPIKQRGMFGSRTPDIDLDASAMLYADRQRVDVCYYGQLSSRDGSLRHQGDNLTGEGEGDDEVINVDLNRVPAHITTIMFIVTSYRGHTFDQLSNAFCRLIDDTTNAELARYTLMGQGMHCTGMVMAKLVRAGNDWKMHAIGEGIQAKHPGEADPQLPRFL